MQTFEHLLQDKRTYGATEADGRRGELSSESDRCPLSEPEDFRCSVAESLPESRVKRTQGWSANGPDGSCGGMVLRRNLKGGAGGAPAKGGERIPPPVGLLFYRDGAVR